MFNRKPKKSVKKATKKVTKKKVVKKVAEPVAEPVTITSATGTREYVLIEYSDGKTEKYVVKSEGNDRYIGLENE